jgi:tyrosinase
MWPWVGDAAGFDVAIPPSVKALLPDFSAAPAATVRQVLNTETIDAEGYHYAPPADG